MDFPGKKAEVVAIRLPFPSPIVCPHFPPSFTENTERAAGSQCWRQENWGTRLPSTGAPGPGTLRRRDMAPPAQPQGCPLLRLASLYLHRAEPQQLSQDNTTTTPEADMAPARHYPTGMPLVRVAGAGRGLFARRWRERMRASARRGRAAGGENVNQILGKAKLCFYGMK